MKKTALLLCICLLLSLSACRRDKPDASAPPVIPPAESSQPSMLPDFPESKEPDESGDAEDASTIDPLEETARLSAEESPAPSSAEILDEAAPSSAIPGLYTSTDPSVKTWYESPSESPKISAVPLRVNAEEIELELLRLINNEREQHGVHVLGMEESMRFAARIRAPEALDYLSHTRPDGSQYYTAFDEAGFTYAGKWHGENISCMFFSVDMYDSVGAAGKMFQGLKDSAGHYQNMLSDNFDQIGVGAFVDNDGTTIRVGSAQMFSSF